MYIPCISTYADPCYLRSPHVNSKQVNVVYLNPDGTMEDAAQRGPAEPSSSTANPTANAGKLAAHKILCVTSIAYCLVAHTFFCNDYPPRSVISYECHWFTPLHGKTNHK